MTLLALAVTTALWLRADNARKHAAQALDDAHRRAYFHSISIANRSYAFAYDDVNDQSSVRILGNSNPPSLLTIGIGW